MPDPAPNAPPPDDQGKRRSRNLSIALMIGAFIVVVYVTTILRIGGAASGG